MLDNISETRKWKKKQFTKMKRRKKQFLKNNTKKQKKEKNRKKMNMIQTVL